MNGTSFNGVQLSGFASPDRDRFAWRGGCDDWECGTNGSSYQGVLLNGVAQRIVASPSCSFGQGREKEQWAGGDTTPQESPGDHVMAGRLSEDHHVARRRLPT